jgi:hypothetical protein
MLSGSSPSIARGGGKGNAVRRGNGEPVQIGRGVCTADGVNTLLGAIEGADELNGDGVATAAWRGVTMVSRLS